MPYAASDGARIYYEVEGDGPPLLLHVGYIQRLQDWRLDGGTLLKTLGAAHRLILVDPRGQGRSDKPHEPAAYTLALRVRDVAAVLDAAGIARAAFWGYSLGGQIGFGVGAYAPERVSALVLGGADPYERAPDPFLAQAATLRQDGMEGAVAAGEARVGPFPPALRAALLANDALALAAHLEARAAYPDLADALATMRPPTLVYAGEDDEAFPGARRAAGAIPGARFVALPGLNHYGAFVTTGAVLPHALDFLNRQD